MRPGQPAARHAFFHALVNALIRFGFFCPPRVSATIRKNTHGMIWPPVRSASFVSFVAVRAGPGDRRS